MQTSLEGLSPWEQDMNPEQLAVIRHVEGPCRVLAQAGSGKTRALVHRIARLINVENVSPEEILAVTFSKKAADEMNHRLRGLKVKDARVGTWHSLCLEILREDRTEWAEWQIDEKGAAEYLVKDAIGFKFLDWKNADLGRVRKFISICKANLWTPSSPEAIKLSHGEPKYLKAFEISQKLIEERALLTFDDFLVFVHRHLSHNAEALAKWQAKWRFILQDEAQDANRAQNEIAKLLAAGHRNYMVVGDTAQSIYGFRGSSPLFLHEFEKEWPDAVTITMCRNYRSGDAIVEVANAIIRPATIRLPEDMIAERHIPGKVESFEAADHEVEAEHFVSIIKEHTRMGDGDLGDITALFRTNAQSRALEEALLKAKIPYVIVGGSSFYERREVKDLLAYLRVAADRDDEGDGVKRCINAPFRFLGQAFVSKLMDRKADRNNDWPELVKATATTAGIQRRQRVSAEEWAELMTKVGGMIKRNSEQVGSSKPASLLAYIVNQTGYIDWLKKDQGDESEDNSHVSNVHELMRVADRFRTVEALLDYIEENIAAAKRQRRDKQAGGDRVLLMSIHRSKGLEWPIVVVVGLQEGTMPIHRADSDLEEERRLAYVAATRARDRLVFTRVRNLATKEGINEAQPSRFLVDAGLVSPVAPFVGEELRQLAKHLSNDALVEDQFIDDAGEVDDVGFEE